MMYHIEVGVSQSDRVLRAKVDDVIRLTLVPGVQADCLKAYSGGKCYSLIELPMEEPVNSRSVEFKCDRSGPVILTILNGDEIATEYTVLVESSIVPNAEQLCLVSVISQKLGFAASDWMTTMRILSRQNFNAVHFTPVQVLGASKSSYSISDHLTVSTNIAPSWDELEAVVQDQIHKELGMLSFCDIVLNHISASSQFIVDHPEVGYNQVNSPWLKAAMALDDVCKDFTHDLVQGKIVHHNSSTKCSPHVHSEHDVNILVDAFVNQYFHPRFNHRHWYTIDVQGTIQAYIDFVRTRKLPSGPRVVPGPLFSLESIIDQAQSFTEAARRCVGECEQFIVRPDILVYYAHDEKHARDLTAWAQQALWEEASGAYSSTIEALKGTLRYERLQQKKGPITYEPWNSVVPWYFTTVEHPETGDKYWLANNGWVMGWNSHRGFIERGGNVYLKRSLVAWSDCVKLRYGTPREEKYEDCPVLWNLMEDYAKLSARVFHGFRLDNCHTTPVAIARHVLSIARSVRPNLFVFAELFTGSEKADIQFEESLGIDALVREAIQTNSPGDEAWHAVKYATRSRRFAELDDDVVLAQNFDAGEKNMTIKRSINIYYDCTHDNETWVQKNRPCDTLASAAIVSASGCAVGSTFGYECIVKSNPSVLADGNLYPSSQIKVPTQAVSSVGDSPMQRAACPDGMSEIRHHAVGASTVTLTGEFCRWQNGVPMTRLQDGEWYVHVDTSKLGLGKFVVDNTRWECSPYYAISRDSSGNENNDLRQPTGFSPSLALTTVDYDASSGIIEARRVLNAIHQEIGDGYVEISLNHYSDDLICLSRSNPLTGMAYHFVIRSAWWIGNPNSSNCSIPLSGRVVGIAPLLCAFVDNQKLDHHNQWALGLTRNVVTRLNPPHATYDGGSDTTWLDIGAYFPSGSVCVYKTEMDRADALIHKHVSTSLKDAMKDITLLDLNPLLWSCDQEERDRSYGERGVYLFPDIRDVVYAGLVGVLDGMRATRETYPNDYHTKGVYRNVKEGDWLIDYHTKRITQLLPDRPNMIAFWKTALHIITSTKRIETKPRAVEKLFSSVYRSCIQRILQSTSLSPKQLSDPLCQALLVATTQVIGRVRSARMNEWNPESISAGLPFFTTEYMREWGRDTMTSIFGLCTPLGRWDVMKASLLCYARVLRHGVVPNLLDSSVKPRYNARDAVHFWLNALQRYCLLAPNGWDILNEVVYLKYHHGLKYNVPMLKHVACENGPEHEYCVTLRDCVRYVLYAHYHGIEYREWNAGYEIDSQMRDEGFNVKVIRDATTGFSVGGNRKNCGTWMDKMGSSEKARNKGWPSSPRDGAPVELTLTLYSTLCWVTGVESDVIPSSGQHHVFGLTDEEMQMYSEWRDQIKRNFVPCYLVKKEDEKKFPPGVAYAETLKDVYMGENTEEDYYVRCNYSIGLGLLLHTDIIPPCIALRALQLAHELLVCEKDQVGMKTLNTQNPRYRPNYDNANDSTDKHVAHGWNYHQGPEWVWPYGYWFEAVWKFLSLIDKANCIDGHNCIKPYEKRVMSEQLGPRLTKIRERITSGPWYSLPEVTDANGRVCVHSCQAQAWSLASFLSYHWLLHRTIKSSGESMLAESVVSEEVAARQSAKPFSQEESSPDKLPRAADFVLTDDDQYPLTKQCGEIQSIATAE